MKKSSKPVAPNVTSLKSKNDDSQFELELCWCVQQLETALHSRKLSRKIADDTMKNLKVLKGTSAPLIKKRQVMKAAMGDYRAKMKEEEKMDIASNQIKFTSVAETVKKSSFIKKSATLTSTKDFKCFCDTAVAGGNATKEVEITPILNSNNLQLSTCKDFTFNFDVNEENEIKFEELSIV